MDGGRKREGVEGKKQVRIKLISKVDTVPYFEVPRRFQWKFIHHHGGVNAENFLSPIHLEVFFTIHESSHSLMEHAFPMSDEKYVSQQDLGP